MRHPVYENKLSNIKWGTFIKQNILQIAVISYQLSIMTCDRHVYFDKLSQAVDSRTDMFAKADHYKSPSVAYHGIVEAMHEAAAHTFAPAAEWNL